MRNLLLVLACSLLALVVPAFADDADGIDTLGKTDAEILAMGRDGWYDFFTANSAAGDSTVGQGQAYASYTAAARRRNAALPQQKHAAELERLLAAFGERALNVAANYHGAGSFWAPMYGVMECDAADAAYVLLGGRPAEAAPQMTGPVNREIRQLSSWLEEARATPDVELVDYARARTDLKQLRQNWQEIKRLAAGLDRRDSDCVLEFCNQWVCSIELLMEVGC